MPTRNRAAVPKATAAVTNVVPLRNLLISMGNLVIVHSCGDGEHAQECGVPGHPPPARRAGQGSGEDPTGPLGGGVVEGGDSAEHPDHGTRCGQRRERRGGDPAVLRLLGGVIQKQEARNKRKKVK